MGNNVFSNRYTSRKNFYVLNCLPSTDAHNADSIISSDLGQMFSDFYNVVAIFVTNATILIALSLQIKSRFVLWGLLAQICFAIMCLPLAKRFVGPVSAAVAALKESDGGFAFQVLDSNSVFHHLCHFSVFQMTTRLTHVLSTPE